MHSSWYSPPPISTSSFHFSPFPTPVEFSTQNKKGWGLQCLQWAQKNGSWRWTRARGVSTSTTKRVHAGGRSVHGGVEVNIRMRDTIFLPMPFRDALHLCSWSLIDNRFKRKLCLLILYYLSLSFFVYPSHFAVVTCISPLVFSFREMVSHLLLWVFV